MPHPSTPRTATLPAQRTSHRVVVEHVDIRDRDFGLDYILGTTPSHRRCAGGPECMHAPATRPVSLVGETLADVSAHQPTRSTR